MTTSGENKQTKAGEIREKYKEKRPSARDMAIVRRSLSGATQREIGAEFGLSAGRVSHIITKVAKWMAARPRELHYLDSADPLSLTERWQLGENLKLEQLHQAIASLWDEWDRSCKPTETWKVSCVEGKDERKIEKTVKSRAGDPRYIGLIRRLLEDVDQARIRAMKRHSRHKESTDATTLEPEQRRLAIHRILELARERNRAATTGGTDPRPESGD